MFLGKYSHSFDSKGRLIIPAKFREEVDGQKLVVVPWWEEDLTVFPEQAFKEYIESLNGLQGSAEKIRRIKRFLLSNAESAKLDAQGRILVGQDLRKFAKLDKDVIITGNMTYFEIWNPETWAKVEEKLNDAEEMRSELESLKMML
ncbi:MAG: division/cell wall cluster transcriptional repressor MraZ [Lachnospiraceae bacterium]|nr:division/cell wall cluster transcriptional repressor MraZ [Lachnospiraceae bacterium]